MKRLLMVTFAVVLAAWCAAGSLAEAPAAARKLTLLLVTCDDKTYAARIEKFLDNEGFACDTVEYTKVTKELCDAHDMIVVDSPSTDQKVWGDMLGRYRKPVTNFPQTERPIFCVGFLGTELLKAKNIALTSGYI